MKKSSIYLWIALLLIILGTLGGCKHNVPTPSPSNSNTNSDSISENIPPQENPPQPQPPVETQPSEPSTPASSSASWWFTRNANHQTPAVPSQIAALLAANNGFYVLPNNEKKIYLTFDCGYELGNTPSILDTLDRHQIKAAFFMTGQFIQTQPELVKRMQASGHLVCNHTWNHPDLPTLSQAKFNQEITSLEQRYNQLTGAQLAHYLRPPNGNYSPDTLKWANELGYRTVFWSIAFQDWDPSNQPGAEYSYQHIMANIHPGAVILLHVVSKSDTDALDRIITDLQKQGYVFSTFNG